MQLPTVRFTIRSLMIAVGIVALVLALESALFHFAVVTVRPSPEDFNPDEAVGVWMILNLAVALEMGLAVAMIRAAVSDHAKAREADRLSDD
jgi:hypothetical protein